MRNRVSFVVLIRLHPGKQAAFEDFERRSMPILRRHGGSLEQRLRGTGGEGPDELHFVSFPDEAAFAAYRSDPEYVALADARAAAIRETTVFGGSPAPAFDANPVDDALRIIGLDHVYLSIADMTRSEPFYDTVMQALGFRKGDKAIASERHAHYFNPVMQITIRPARLPDRADPYRAGLHHLCLQAASEADVDEAYARLTKLHVACTPPKKYPEYNPDYYATFFEDPDGIRFEVVARTPHRERVARRWSDFTVFLNPVGELLAREPSGR
jgi:catechol 2,3-dioxygenase-like lactoylglutathione lyase family enzyme